MPSKKSDSIKSNKDSERKALNYHEAVNEARIQSPGYKVWQSIVLILPFSGAMFLLWYIKGASLDVVYSDYIRLINSYLPDTLAKESFLVPDVLTRIPVTYLIRWINVTFFSYSVNFDRLLGVLGVLIMMFTVSLYINRMHFNVFSVIALMAVGFSLNKWELLLNGSGYPHFLSYGLFFYNYYILERVFTGTKKRYDDVLLTVLPYIALLTAGPYIVQYCAALIASALYMLVIKNRNVDRSRIPIYVITTAIPVIMFLWSNSMARYEYAGAADVTLMEVLTKQTGFTVHFILNGFASELLSGSCLESMLGLGVIGYSDIYLTGAIVVATYLLAFILFFRKGIYKKTVFPLILMVSGLSSHALVFLSRYIFLTEIYAWQSRYSLQYMPGVLGLIMIYGLLFTDWYERYLVYRHKEKRLEPESRKRRRSNPGVLSLVCLFFALAIPVSFIAGTLVTGRLEMSNMPYRKIYFESIREAALNVDDYTDDELNAIFEYNHGANKVRHAISVLQDNKLNVFREG
ncbi:hypothetical protein SAMN05216349_10591 [Oribacterium sp. KHPX15]|uniref:hypothetical protein n=1 Tax=unclassified Oribacterium TaxID=2629782 RepID=UPI0006796429|nr:MULTISPECIES: hypothetical protein [unclassified Oribacterium]SEA13435.1 hypothetical protein SAMN05216349_10591 [Oribacterium sp. KHPX15]